MLYFSKRILLSCSKHPRVAARSVVKVVSGLGLEWQAAFAIVVGLYFYSHYFFASGRESLTGCTE